MTTILSQKEAVAILADMSGNIAKPDEQDLLWIEEEIGDPNALVPITRTTETVDDFRASGFEDYANGSHNRPGFTILKRGRNTFANIADCGDYRLVTIER